jgi:hypothetical protein
VTQQLTAMDLQLTTSSDQHVRSVTRFLRVSATTQRLPLAITYLMCKNGTASTRRHVKERARFPIVFAVATKGPQ